MFVFWKNWGYQKVLLKLTDFYLLGSTSFLCALPRIVNWSGSKWTMTKVRAAIMKRAVAVIVSCTEWLTQRCAFTSSLYLSKKLYIWKKVFHSMNSPISNFEFQIFLIRPYIFSIKMSRQTNSRFWISILEIKKPS